MSLIPNKIHGRIMLTDRHERPEIEILKRSKRFTAQQPRHVFGHVIALLKRHLTQRRKGFAVSPHAKRAIPQNKLMVVA